MNRIVQMLLVASVTTTFAVAADDYADPTITPHEKSHWSFQVPVRPAEPTVKRANWVKNPIDAFILARLEAAGLTPSAEANRITLIRRVTLDLTGLPPTPDEVAEFIKDSRPDAYERVVDRLLASPHFGERAAQQWLDVVRFAESNGYEADLERPHAWRYRDYVIRSFNDDKPYDTFLTEQIAGDELASGQEPRTVADLWVATGMHRCGPVHLVSGNLDTEALRQEVLTEMVNGLGSTVLGLTVGCARCHDHKFDPISQGDYYRLQAFFAGAEYVDVNLATPDEKTAVKKQNDAINAQLTPLKAQVSALDAPYRARVAQAKRDALDPQTKLALDTPSEKRTPEQKKLAAESGVLLKVSWDEVLAVMSPADLAKRAEVREKIHKLEAEMPAPAPAAWAIRRADEPPKTFVLKRGNPRSKWTIVNSEFPRVFTEKPTAAKTRLELANWLTRPNHPLTARVMANRIWSSHFGRGIVASPNDFGVRGDRPSHPELLDWLASELVKPATTGTVPAKPWGLKHLHRLIVLSATYRQSSTTATTPVTSKSDPDNRMLWRMNRRRLEAEAIRDSILTASGTLNRALGGRSIKVPLEPEVYDLIFTEGEPDGLWPVTPDRSQHVRRSIYLLNKRNVRLPLFEAFDQPDSLNSCAVRPVSTFAPQALILMNGPLTHEQAKALMARLYREVGDTTQLQIDLLYKLTLGRLPREDEKRLALEFLDAQTLSAQIRLKEQLPLGIDPSLLPKGTDLAKARALTDLCGVLFNTNEFVHIP